jgi:hypothetical protein
MNKHDFEAFCYILGILFIEYSKFYSILLCLDRILHNKILSFLCLITYFIFLSETEWEYLLKISIPIAFWSVFI